MGVLIGVLISVIATFSLLTGQFSFFNKQKENNESEVVIKEVANQTYQVFAGSYAYISSIGAQPSNWSIQTLINSNILPSTFGVLAPDGSYRNALGQTYAIYYTSNSCNSYVMDLVIKINDTNDLYNQTMYQKAGITESQMGKKAVYSQIIQHLQNYDFKKFNMVNPCNANLPSYQIGYVLNGQAYINNQRVSFNNLPSSFYQNDGVFIYAFAPNQYGYLVVNLRMFRGDEFYNEYYDYSPNSLYNRCLYMNEYLGWHQYSVIWQQTCPSGYTDISSYNPNSTVINQPTGRINICIPALKSQVRSELTNWLFKWRWYGVSGGLNGNTPQLSPSRGRCVIGQDGENFSTDSFYRYLGRLWVWSVYCSDSDFPNASALDSGIGQYINPYLYVVHQQAWGGLSVSFLQNNEPLIPFPQPSFFVVGGWTIYNPINQRYYQLVTYGYKFYTGQGCSPSSLGINSSSAPFRYPSQATIWATGYKWYTGNTTDVGGDISCSSSWLNGAYGNLGTSQRYTGSGIIVRVLDNSGDASSYTVPITFSPTGKGGSTTTFNLVIPTPIVR